MATIAINGLGRIGRAAFKILLETRELELRAVNDLNSAEDLAYLLNYDTVYGRYHKKVAAVPDGLRVAEKTYPVFSGQDRSAADAPRLKKSTESLQKKRTATDTGASSV